MAQIAYSLHEASKTTEIPQSIIREGIKRGELRAVRIKRRIVLRHEALDMWLKSYERRGLIDD